MDTTPTIEVIDDTVVQKTVTAIDDYVSDLDNQIAAHTGIMENEQRIIADLQAQKDAVLAQQ